MNTVASTRKKIPSARLRPGMFLVELGGSWLEHPFWKSAFLIQEQDIDRIRTSGIGEVWIDTSRGLDVEEETPAGDSATQSARQIEEDMQDAVITGQARPRKTGTERLPMERELERASKLCEEAKSAVTSMFQEARMGRAIDAGAAAPLVEEISESVSRNPAALISLARLKTWDQYTYMHSVAVCALMVAVSRKLGLDERETRAAGMAGLLHDLGKARIPLDILNKPGRLTEAEFAKVREHPELGWEVLRGWKGVGDAALDVCLHHHEKVDGSGYPHRLQDAQISLFAKMGAVCDVYDAITSNRPYKAGWEPGTSLRKMAEWSEGHFDKRVFEAFVNSVGIYPVGSLVRLRSGRLGVVIEQSDGSLLEPRVKVFFSTKSGTHIVPEVIDLSRSGRNEGIVALENVADWDFKDFDRLWAGDAAPRG